jgi:hypothetical protein
MFASQLLPRPLQDRPVLLRDSGRGLAGHFLQNGNFAVALDEFARESQRRQSLNRLTRHWPRHDVAANKNPVDTNLANFPQHGIKCRKVRVYVVKGSDSHGEEFTPPRVRNFSSRDAARGTESRP